MMTPIEISRIKFSTSFRGYNENEVNDFILRISREFEEAYKRLNLLEAENTKLKNEIKGFQEMESGLRKTLSSAQKTSSQIREDAERKSEIILREAELNAERIVEDARNEVKSLSSKIRKLKKQELLVKQELREVLKKYMDNLEL
jgi:cell division initiation protein